MGPPVVDHLGRNVIRRLVEHAQPLRTVETKTVIHVTFQLSAYNHILLIPQDWRHSLSQTNFQYAPSMRYTLFEEFDKRARSLAQDLRSLAALISERIAFGLALERDLEFASSLSEEIVDENGRKRVGVLIDEAGPVIYLNKQGIESISLIYVQTGAEVIRPIAGGDKLAEISNAFLRTNANRDASQLVTELLTNPSGLSRERFLEAMRWRDLYAVSAYKWMTMASMLLEISRSKMKNTVVKRNIKQRYVALEYDSFVQAMGVMGSLACAGPDNSWLSDVSSILIGKTWTPSYVLTRERTMLATSQGSFMASAFGLEAIPIYFRRLEKSDLPFAIFDAVLGLVSVANRYAESKDVVLEGITNYLDEQASRSPILTPVARALAASATLTLRSPEQAMQFVRYWAGSFSPSNASTELDDIRALLGSATDGACSVGGYFPSILATPYFTQNTISHIFPEQSSILPLQPDAQFVRARQALLNSDSMDLVVDEAPDAAKIN